MHTDPALDAALDAYSAVRAVYFTALDCDRDDRALGAAFQAALDAARDCGLSPLTAVSLIVRKIHNERE